MIKTNSKFITTNEASALSGFSADYIRKLLVAGRIKGEKLGINWILKKKELNKIKRKRHSKKRG